MKQRQRNRGIVIELTALLDVILIMLFWVMINVQGETQEVREESKAQVSALEQRLEKVEAEAKKEIEKAWEEARAVNEEATANKQALIEYEQGLKVELRLRYETSAVLSVKIHEEEVVSLPLEESSEQILAERLAQALKEAGIAREEVVLCAFIYDGSVALYRDVNSVKGAMEIVTAMYSKCYCANINVA